MPFSDETLLIAIILRMLHGRVGSSRVMRVFSYCPEIAVMGAMPFEHRYLAYFVAQSGNGGLGRDKTDTSDAMLLREWTIFSKSLRARSPQLRYYAEKETDILPRLNDAGIPHRVIDLIRDPRDIYVSARAYARRAGREQFGIDPRLPEQANVTRFLVDVASRMAAIGSPAGGVPPLLLRYEDLVTQPGPIGRRLGEYLTLDTNPPGEVPFDHLHATSPDVSTSVGRWRRELSSEVANFMTGMLASWLAKYGYDNVAPRSE